MLAIDNILIPHDLSASKLGWCKDGEVDFLLGADNNRFLVRDDPAYKNVAKPANLRLLKSPLLKGPIAFGQLTGETEVEGETVEGTEIPKDGEESDNLKVSGHSDDSIEINAYHTCCKKNGDVKCNQKEVKDTSDDRNVELLHQEDDEEMFYHPPSSSDSESEVITEMSKPREESTDGYHTCGEVTCDNISDDPMKPPSLGTNDGVDSTEES